MCAIAKGIATGLAAHYGETVRITETSCMHKGDPECTISVRLIS
jgi:predicted hydrocarbon binding protein